ncbi:hypothetical protein F5X98DRAFT_371294 [Xylaria grammica]|nr:hypothetical protein F5X98DRAFT_371294 [Xylaria grammica]
MSNLPRVEIYRQPPYISNSIGNPYLLLRSHYPSYTRNCNCFPLILSEQGRFRRRSTGDITPKAPKATHISPTRSSSSTRCHYTKKTANPRRHHRGIVKRQEHYRRRPIPLRPQTVAEHHANTQADASAATSSKSASGSSCEQDLITTSTSLLDCRANEETTAQISADNTDGANQAPETPQREQLQEESEDDSTPTSQEDDGQQALAPAPHPKTEHEANLLATSEETRGLYEEYYKRTHGDRGAGAEEDVSDGYWQWDVKRQQWFHTDADTQSVVWFLG